MRVGDFFPYPHCHDKILGDDECSIKKRKKTAFYYAVEPPNNRNLLDHLQVHTSKCRPLCGAFLLKRPSSFWGNETIWNINIYCRVDISGNYAFIENIFYFFQKIFDFKIKALPRTRYCLENFARATIGNIYYQKLLSKTISLHPTGTNTISASLQISSHLLQKFLLKNFFLCAVSSIITG